MPESIKGPDGPIRLTAEVGRSGLKTWGGVVREEFLPELQGPRGIKVFEEMRKNDPGIAAGLRAISWMLTQLDWDTEPGGETPADVEAAEFVESCRADMSVPWTRVISDALTMLPFGWSYCEVTYKQRKGADADPASLYDDGKLGWRKISLIGQSSLSRWELDPDGGIRGMWQLQDTGAEVLIPIEKSLLFRLDPEKNNPEGTSLLRSVYYPWYVRKNIQEIEAIGIERDLTGLLVIYLPVSATATDKSKAQDIGEQFHVDDMSTLIAPQFGPQPHENWRFEIINSPGSKSIDTDKIVGRYSFEIARSFFTQFLLLGQASGATGSWSLGQTQRGLFETALGTIVAIVEDVLNRYLLPPLFRYNDFGQLTALPRLRAGRISRSDLDAFGKALLSLTQAGLLTPDPDLEKYIRQQFELPEPPEDLETQAAKPEPEETGQEEESQQATEPEPTEGDEPEPIEVPPYDDDEDERLNDILRRAGKGKGLAEQVLRRFARAQSYADTVAEIRAQSEAAMRDLARQYREGAIDHRAWVRQMTTGIGQATRLGYKLGLAQATGVDPWHYSTARERAAADKLVGQQLDYFRRFEEQVRRDVRAGKTLTEALDSRAGMYSGAVASAFSETELREGAEQSLTWVRHKHDSCSTCLAMDGQTKARSEWVAGGVWPAHGTQCLSRCGCTLSPAE